MKLRDMMNPEGIVVKTTTGYAYRYFMRDYLNSVRYVSGIEQLTDYDPLGAVISSVNLDKNSYLYESKERYADFSAAYNGVYDFGARFYNPLYGRWFTTDPAKQSVNPYMYCANNPVQLVDPDGNEVIIIGDKNLIKMIIRQLQSNVSKDLELELGEDGSLMYNTLQPQKKMSSNSKKLIEAIESKDITVNIYLRAVKVFNDSEMIGGAFMGNTYDATTGRVVTTQYVDPEFMEHFDKAYEPGAGAMHEVLESFEGGKMAIKKGRSIPNSNIDKRSYTKAHSRSSYIPKIGFDYMDNSGNILENGVNASSVDVYYNNSVGTGSIDVYIVTMPYKYIEPN